MKRSYSMTLVTHWPMQFLVPLGLWAMIILSLAGGDVRRISDLGSLSSIFLVLRALLPIFAGCLAVALILFKFYQRRPGISLFLGPLGLAGLYGLVGVIAALRVSDSGMSLYWVAVYLSVPLVLWAVVWGNDSLELIGRILRFNWLVLGIAVTVLFAVAILYLDLVALAATPPSWFKCELNSVWQGNSWLNLTSGVLRPTGVARYAAIAGIISITGIWQGQRRSLWTLVLIGSLSLLLTSGARGAFLGFGVAVPLVILLHWGKKSVIAGMLAVLVVSAVLWQTGAYRDFLSDCARVFSSTAAAAPAVQPPGTPEIESPATTLAGESSSGETEQEQLSLGLVATPALGVPVQERSLPQPVTTPETSAPARDQISLPGPVELSPNETSSAVPAQPEAESNSPFNTGFLTLSGRTLVWAEAWELFKRAPAFGSGFHADRRLLGTHIHNSFLHALVQTGSIGATMFVAALGLGWVLLLIAVKNRGYLTVAHQGLVVQSTGVLTFLSIRTLTESTGAFFGVDWLILAPLLLYLQVVATRQRELLDLRQASAQAP